MEGEKVAAFVTGGTGLLGSRLIYDLLQTGRKVLALKRIDSETTLTDRYIKGLNPELRWITGDITDIYSFYEEMSGVDEVYHCAAAVDFNTLNEDLIYKVNVDGTANIVNAALELNIGKFCHVSSVATLGKPETGEELNENNWKEINKNSVYTITKFQAEREVWRGIAEGLNAVIVNPVIILGPGDWKVDSSKIIALIASGLKYFTKGNISLVDVKDVSALMIKLMDEKIFGERFIISAGTSSYKEFFDEVANCLGIDPPNFELTKWIVDLGWRADALKALITRQPQILTREIAHALFRNYTVSNKKIIERTGHRFISMHDMVDEICHTYLEEEVI